MFQLIFASCLSIVLLSKYYDWLICKDKLDIKTKILIVLCTIFVIAVFSEKLFGLQF